MGFAESVLEEITFSRLEGPVPEARNCTASRDTLLPKLISGELWARALASHKVLRTR